MRLAAPKNRLPSRRPDRKTELYPRRACECPARAVWAVPPEIPTFRAPKGFSSYPTVTAVPDATTINMLPLSPTVSVVEVHADHGVGAQLPGFVLHLFEGQEFRFLELFLIARGTAADDVADPGEHVAKHVGAHHRFAADNAVISLYGSPFERRCGRYEHGSSAS